jgi:pyrroloquinoline-quinone synthase
MFSLATLDPMIASKSLLIHPFYQKWNRGELTLEQLKVYAREYFYLVQKIPGIVTAVRAHVSDPVLQMRIDQNIREETEHIELWVRFAKALGISEQELRDYVPSEQVKLAVRALEETVAQGPDEAVAAMYALERELPMIAQTKKEGLERFYNLTSNDAHIYFDEHLNEEKHFAVWMTVPLTETRARPAVEASMKAQIQVLDAVCLHCGIECDCVME